MSNSSPDKKATDVVSIKVFLNGTEMNASYKILSVDVHSAFNKIATAKLTIADGDPAKQDFNISSKEDNLFPGNDIEIKMGYHGALKSVFKGIVVKQSIKSIKNKSSFMSIEAKDKFVNLTLARRSNCFFNKTDSDIIEEIITKAGLNGTDKDIAATSTTHTEMVQYNVTDWDFIISRAEMNSMLVLAHNNKLVIKGPDTNQQAEKEIVYGKEVIEFESETDGRTQTEEVKSHSWDYKDQAKIEGEASSIAFKENGVPDGKTLAGKFGGKTIDLFHPGRINKNELKSWSSARLLKSRLAKNIGYVKIKGNPEFNPGRMITLKGFGKRFNGNVLVTGVRHGYHEKSIWETEIHYGMPMNWFYEKNNIMEHAASGMVPGIQGLHIGIVTQLENDPEKEDRVKIQLPLVHGSESLWARVSSLDAGKERGTFFRPEIDDEVVVGFLDGDPRHPVILGMLHSSAKPAPLKSEDNNHEKGFVTRSKMKLLFNDEKKSITIETPGGKKLLISDDADEISISDSHGNKILLDPSGIVLESGKDITYKTSSGTCKIEANNISLEAAIKLNANGKSAANFTSSGQTVLKGSMVNIN
ncbi:MAG TPA: type VI secretion system tip protein VgrG [Chitinophagaceae bacterium]|nr:type VI secretion system tip protein VgrG [Chitinophagaceae bacterium]